MQVVPGGDDHGLDVRILQNILFGAGTVGESELLRSVAAARASRVRDSHQRDPGNFFERRQQRVLREVTGPEHS